MTESKPRAARSNSLQRMLDLEKKYMRERLQAQPGQPDHSQPPTPTSPSSISISNYQKRQTLPPPHTSIQSRRGSSWTMTTGQARRDSSLPPRLPPLVIDTSVTMSRSDLLLEKGRGGCLASGGTSAAPSATANDKPSKNVAFEFPPTTSDTKGSTCTSPSWEAYEQRKKDKKAEKKAEKKEKEESRGRTRRLVKQPPPSVISQNEVSRAAPLPHKATSVVDDDAGAATRGRRRDRASSAAALNHSDPNKENVNAAAAVPAPPKKARSRSNSFVSLLRAPFEFRRSSIDQGAESDSGFIGGIKLNIQRQAARRVAQDCQPVEDDIDDGDIHPALRAGNNSNNTRRSAAPLKSPPPPPRDGGASNNTRHYPPITRGKNATKQPTALVSPTAPAIPDLSKIDKWRARVGLKTHSKVEPLGQTLEDAHLNGATAAAVASPMPQRNNNAFFGGKPQVKDMGRYKSQPPAPRNYHARRPSQPTQPLPDQMHPGQRNTVHIAFAATDPPTPQRTSELPDTRYRDYSNNESWLSDMSAADSDYYTASTSRPSPPLPAVDALAPVPFPPRRSSKRQSLLRMTCSSLPLTTESPNQFLAVQDLLDQLESPSSKFFPSNGSGVDAVSPPPRKSTEKPRGLAACMSTKHPSSVALPPASHIAGNVVPGSSSEESGSDDHDLHSVSAMSTPATSRPQSERGLSLVTSKEANSTAETLITNGSFPNETSPKLRDQRSFRHTTYPVNSAENSDDEDMDPIQAAAEKVLAQFNEIPTQRQAGLHTRSHSQSTLATDASFSTPPPPPLKERPLKLRPTTMPENRGRNQRLSVPMSPPPPLMSPLSVSDYNHSDRGSERQSFASMDKRLSPLGPMTGRPLRQQSTPMLNTRDSGPVTKVFVECCSCRYYHDMPSDLYEAMANPEDMLRPMDKYGYSPTSLSMTVKCPWCRHEMSTRCCAGFAATVYIRERLH